MKPSATELVPPAFLWPFLPAAVPCGLTCSENKFLDLRCHVTGVSQEDSFS